MSKIQQLLLLGAYAAPGPWKGDSEVGLTSRTFTENNEMSDGKAPAPTLPQVFPTPPAGTSQ